ncbi:MAG TPA: 30S ribosomal protein S20 [Bacillota bacterium]
MANIKSAKKRVLTSSIRRLRNRSEMAALRTAVKKFEQALDNDIEQAKVAMPLIYKKLDQAAAKGLIHKNVAARKKSRLMQRLNKRSAANS